MDSAKCLPYAHQYRAQPLLENYFWAMRSAHKKHKKYFLTWFLRGWPLFERALYWHANGIFASKLEIDSIWIPHNVGGIKKDEKLFMMHFVGGTTLVRKKQRISWLLCDHHLVDKFRTKNLTYLFWLQRRLFLNPLFWVQLETILLCKCTKPCKQMYKQWYLSMLEL